MDKFMKFMNEKFAPIADKISKNNYVSGLQDAIMATLPFIFVGSLITIYGVLQTYIPSMPDLTMINSFTFGLIGIFMAFLVPYCILNKFKVNDHKLSAALANVAFLLISAGPVFDDMGNITYMFSRFGAEGMLLGILGGLLVSYIYIGFDKMKILEDSSLPDFLARVFAQIIPVTIVVGLGFVLAFIFKIDIFNLILKMFSPLQSIAQTMPGFVLLTLIPIVFYSFGLSPWLTYPITATIWTMAIAENAALVEAGQQAIYINTAETLTAWLQIGGMGTTLPLCILMMFAKSRRLKTISKVCIGPSILNINEPLMFGAPVALNPFLMIPMWIITIVGSVIVYLALNMGLVAIPAKIFGLWFMPPVLSALAVDSGIPGLILLLIVVALAFVIYYPFLKVYDNRLVEEEKNSN